MTRWFDQTTQISNEDKNITKLYIQQWKRHTTVETLRPKSSNRSNTFELCEANAPVLKCSELLYVFMFIQ